uniref:Phosducin domain-containing protein n=1 Tax=Macrostomum lignano TaxID=282301 RepID=A0A1I8J0P8_9PLAT
MSRPDALGRSLAEPAHVDQLFSGSAFSANPVDQNRPKAEPTGGSSGSGGAGSGGGGGGGGTTDGSTIPARRQHDYRHDSIGVAAGRGRSGMDNPARRDWRREFDELCSMQNTLQQKQQRRRAEEKKVSGGLRGPKNLGPNEQNSKPIFSDASTGDNKDWRSRIDAGFRETEDDNSSTMAEMDNGHSATYMNNNSNLATQEFAIDEEADAEAGLEDSFGVVSEVEATETRASSMVGKRFKDNVCVADCMRLQSLSCKGYADLSDDSDSSDPDEAPSDLLLRLKRRLVLSRAKSRVRN